MGGREYTSLTALRAQDCHHLRAGDGKLETRGAAQGHTAYVGLKPKVSLGCGVGWGVRDAGPCFTGNPGRAASTLLGVLTDIQKEKWHGRRAEPPKGTEGISEGQMPSLWLGTVLVDAGILFHQIRLQCGVPTSRFAPTLPPSFTWPPESWS